MTGGLRRFVRRRLAQGGDRGGAVLRADRGATAIEFVLLTPIMFFMIFGAVQFAMYSFGESVAKAAAQAGARTARAEFDRNPNWLGQARQTTDAYLTELGRGMFESEPRVVIRPTGSEADQNVRVDVEVEVPSILGFIDITVHAASEGPVERFEEDVQ